MNRTLTYPALTQVTQIKNLLIVAIIATMVATCADETEPQRDLMHSRSSMMLYGATETDRPESVGALIYADNYSSFCTATLIAPQWVLTAAHCIEDRKPADLLFTLSSDVRQLDSPVHEVRRLIIHPDYRTTTFINDIALVALAAPINNIDFPALQTNLPDDTFIQTEPDFVGYGYNEDRHSGTKRTARIPVLSVGIATFTTHYTSSMETGACFGDSGGPVFDTIDDDSQLLGVVSNILSDDSDDPCVGSYNVTRVDKYTNWILTTIGETTNLQLCTDDESICFCRDACMDNGTCDNARCAIMDCEQSYDCIGRCNKADGACMNDCHILTAIPDLATFEAYLKCGNDACVGTEEQALLNCLIDECHNSFHSCFGATDCALTGGDCEANTTCREGRYSLTSCQPSDSKPLGAPCTSSDEDVYPCADGLFCARIDNEPVCAQLCFSDEDCDENQECMDVPVGEFREQAYSVCTQKRPRAQSHRCQYLPVTGPERASLLNVLF